MSSAAAARVREVVEPVVTASGCDLEDVVVRRAGSRELVLVVVDRDGGISLDDVAAVSRQCSEALDTADVLNAAYVLEVTSPGVDRPLTLPRHWRRNVSRLVKAKRSDGTSFTGRVTAADDAVVAFDVDGKPLAVPVADLVEGRVQVEFNRPGDKKGGGAS